MGQTINPNIVRVVKTNDWKSKYFEKKSTDSPVYSIKDIKLRNFVSNFFKSNRVTINNCTIFYLNNSVHILVSYFQNPASNYLLNIIKKNQRIKTKTRKKKYYRKIKKQGNKKTKIKLRIHKKLQKSLRFYLPYKKIYYTKKLQFHNQNKCQEFKNLKSLPKLLRIKKISRYKNFLMIKHSKNIKNIKSNRFFEKFFESIARFFKKKISVNLTLLSLNKETKKNLIKTKKKFRIIQKRIIKLRRFMRNDYFKEGINIIFILLAHKNPANIIAEFICVQLRKLKKHHNFFIKFIKMIILIVKKHIETLNGIKIQIKGRFNGRNRARKKTIRLGNLPILTLDSMIEYSEKTSYTRNGTFGVKIWVNHIPEEKVKNV